MRYFSNNPSTSQPKPVALPQYRTIRECVAELKKIDSGTAVTEFFVRQLCKQNKIKYIASGNKSLVSYDDLLRYLGSPDNYIQTTNQKYNLGDYDFG